MNTELISFHNHPLVTVEKNGKVYVAMKPIAEAIGLHWEGQRQLLKRDAVLSTCTCMIKVQVAGDIQSRPMVFLELPKLNGWLFKIDASRLKPEVKNTVIQYQLECYDVLYHHFHGKALNQQIKYYFDRHPDHAFICRLAYEGYPYKAIGQMFNPVRKTARSISATIGRLIEKGFMNPEKLALAQAGPARLSAQKKASFWGQQSFVF